MRRILQFSIVLVVLISGCSNKIQSITNGEWLKIISERSNINSYSETSPYYLNIDKGNEYFTIVQALHEYGVINNQYQLDLDEPLKREFVAYTLVNLYGEELNGGTVKDSNKSIYAKHINKIVSIGLMNLDSRKLFNPKKLISKDDANNLLDKVLLFIDNRQFEDSTFEYTLNEENIIEETPISYDKSNDKAVYSTDTNLKKDDIVAFKDEGQEVFKKVEEVIVNEEEVEVKFKEPEVEEVFEEIKTYDTFEVDFNNAIIEDLTSAYNYENTFDYINVSSIKNSSFTIDDFNVKYSVSSGNININVTKKLKNGSVAYANASLFKVKPSYKWNMEGSNIKEGYFKIDFKTNQSFGIKREHYKKYYGDFSYILPGEFLNTVKGLFSNDSILGSIPICKVSVPIPNIPTMKIVFKLQLNIYASGKVELNLANEHSAGMEIRNNSIRLISNHDNKTDFIVQADGKIMLGVESALNLANLKLADIGVSAGVKAYLKSNVYLYGSNGKVNKIESDLPYDLLSELSENNNDIKTCGDLNVYKALDLSLNTKESIAGKLGLSKTFHIFDEKNGSLLDGLSKHIQNMRFVDKCNVNDRVKNTSDIVLSDTSKIILKNYSLIIGVNESKVIEFLELPEGYNLKDLSFTASNNYFKVNSRGEVSGNQMGNGIVTIKTNDNKHSVKCHIFVKE